MSDNRKIAEQGFFSMIDNDTEFIPLITPEDEEQFDAEETPKEIPILTLRNTVLFPGVVIPITVGRDKSIKLIQEAYQKKMKVGVIAQVDQKVENPEFEDLHKVGTQAQILRLLKMPDGSTTAIIQGKKKFKLNQLVQTEPYLRATVNEFVEIKPIKSDKKLQALMSSIKDMALEIINLSPNIPTEASFALKNIESYNFLVNFIASNMNANTQTKQKLLEEPDFQKRADMIIEYLNKELQMLELKNDIQSKVKHDIDQQQREYFLHQQMEDHSGGVGFKPSGRRYSGVEREGGQDEVERGNRDCLL